MASTSAHAHPPPPLLPPLPPIASPPHYAFDPAFFTRFGNLRLLHTPLHLQASPATPHLPFCAGGAPAAAAAQDALLPEDELGGAAAGHFGVVFSATERATGRKVAIKFSKENFDGRAWENPYQGERAQVMEEMHTHAAASQLNHPNILKLLYAAEVEVDLTRWLPECQPGALRRHAFVMEYASGHRLQDVLADHDTIGTLARVEIGGGGGGGGGGGAAASPAPRDRRPYLEADKRTLFRQILSALEALHAAGITHRDIKPENIMLRHAPVVREEHLHDKQAAQRDIQLDLCVFDFGLAIRYDAAKPLGPGNGDVRAQPRAPPNFVGNIGSLYYLPPEVLERFGTPKTPADTPYRPPMDVFAAGVVLYLMLLGDSHQDCDGSRGRSGTWDAAAGALRPTWDLYRENLLPFAKRTERVDVAAWGAGGLNQRKTLLVPRLRMLAPSQAPPPSDPVEAAIAAEHHRRSLLLSEHARDLLARLLAADPAARPTAAAALQHPWFQAPPGELHSHADPAALEAASHRIAQVLRESSLGRAHALAPLRCVGRMRARLARARHSLTLAAQRTALDSERVQAVLARFHALEQERRRSSGAGGAGAAAPSIHADRGLTREGLQRVLLESGVGADVADAVLPTLWRELADGGASGLVKEHEFLTLLPLLCAPPLALEGPLGLYFDLWDANGDGCLTEDELVSLMEAVQGLLPDEASEEAAAATHARLVVKAHQYMLTQPDRRITKSAFVMAFKNHREPVSELVVPLQNLH